MVSGLKITGDFQNGAEAVSKQFDAGFAVPITRFFQICFLAVLCFIHFNFY
jgi:hypothetical protein